MLELHDNMWAWWRNGSALAYGARGCAFESRLGRTLFYTFYAFSSTPHLAPFYNETQDS